MEIKYIKKGFNPFDCKLGRVVGNFEELQSLYNLKLDDGVKQPFIVLDENGLPFSTSVSSGSAHVAIVFDAVDCVDEDPSVYGRTQVPNYGKGTLTKWLINRAYKFEKGGVLNYLKYDERIIGNHMFNSKQDFLEYLHGCDIYRLIQILIYNSRLSDAPRKYGDELIIIVDDDTAIRYNRGYATEFHVDTRESIAREIYYNFAHCDMDGNPILFSEEKLKHYKDYLPYAVVFYPDEHQELKDILTYLKSKRVYFNMYRKEIQWCLDRLENSKIAPEYKAIVRKVLTSSKAISKGSSFKKSTSFTSNARN